jgi:hypothetical protein
MESNVTHLLVQHGPDQGSTARSDVVQSSSGNITYHLKATSSEVASLIERSGIDAAQQIERQAASIRGCRMSPRTTWTRWPAPMATSGYLDQAAAQIVAGVEDATHKLSDRLSSTNDQFLTGLTRRRTSSSPS